MELDCELWYVKYCGLLVNVASLCMAINTHPCICCNLVRSRLVRELVQVLVLPEEHGLGTLMVISVQSL